MHHLLPMMLLQHQAHLTEMGPKTQGSDKKFSHKPPVYGLAPYLFLSFSRLRPQLTLLSPHQSAQEGMAVETVFFPRQSFFNPGQTLPGRADGYPASSPKPQQFHHPRSSHPTPVKGSSQLFLLVVPSISCRREASLCCVY